MISIKSIDINGGHASIKTIYNEIINTDDMSDKSLSGSNCDKFNKFKYFEMNKIVKIQRIFQYSTAYHAGSRQPL